jgi:threonyl-tRNA synthetase
MLVVGDKEIAASTVSVRRRSGEKLDSRPFGGFKQDLKAMILSRANEL